MKKMIFVMFAFALLFLGCTIPTEFGEENIVYITGGENISEIVAGINLEDYIEASEENGAYIVVIRAFEKEGKYYFPLEGYKDGFMSIGEHQEMFIKLDNEYIDSFEEGEAIWLYPMVGGNNTGILFKAFYSNELECDQTEVNILGEEYELSELEDGESFNNDDKWKIAYEYEGDCATRLVIYMDGYFYDLKNEEQIDLFVNNGPLTLEFMDLKNEPKVVIKAEKKPAELQELPEKYEVNNIIENYFFLGHNITETELLNETGLFISFNPLMKLCYYPNECFGDLNNDYHRGYAIEDNAVHIQIGDKSYVISRLRPDYFNESYGYYEQKANLTEELELGKEKEYYDIVAPSGCNSPDLINISSYSLGFENFNYDEEILFIDNKTGENFTVEIGESLKIDNEYLHVWAYAPGYTWCASWVRVSVFSDIVNITDPEYGASLTWVEDEEYGIALSSIYIPRSSKLLNEFYQEEESNEKLKEETETVIFSDYLHYSDEFKYGELIFLATEINPELIDYEGDAEIRVFYNSSEITWENGYEGYLEKITIFSGETKTMDLGEYGKYKITAEEIGMSSTSFAGWWIKANITKIG